LFVEAAWIIRPILFMAYALRSNRLNSIPNAGTVIETETTFRCAFIVVEEEPGG
jgi:hypothetical protein